MISQNMVLSLLSCLAAASPLVSAAPVQAHVKRWGPATLPPGFHGVPGIEANAAILDPAYQTLTNALPQVLTNAISASNQSWEQGTLVNALTEVFYPKYSPFDYDPENESTPWLVIDEMTAVLQNYSWSGSPSNRGDKEYDVVRYLDNTTSPTPINYSQPLVDGAGALGDPASLGAGAWTVATAFGDQAVIDAYPGAKDAADWGWAVGNQLAHLLNGTRANNSDLISQREGHFELWSDMGYMISPFLAYLGIGASRPDLLHQSIEQWTLVADALLNTTGVFNHVPSFDNRPWATGNAWMLAGFARVAGAIQDSGVGGLDDELNTAADIALGVFTKLFSILDADNLVPNYMFGTGDGAGDAAGTALIVSAYYRFRTLFNDKATPDLDKAACDAFTAVVGFLDDAAWLQHVVDPLGNTAYQGKNGFVVTGFTGVSPEAQSFLGLMWAARTQAGI